MRVLGLTALAAVLCLTGPAGATVIATGTLSSTQTTGLFGPAIGQGIFADFGTKGVGYAKTVSVTIWSTTPLAEAFVNQGLNFSNIWLSDDGKIETGSTRLTTSEYYNLLTDPSAIRTEHSYTIQIHLPWSWTVPDLVCCEDGGAVPGTLTNNWKSTGTTFEMRPAGGVEGAQYWITYDDRTPPSNAVPEPATWAMMILGFGLAGAAMRRRRVVAA